MSAYIIDLEVQNHKYFGALASPRHPDNFVVAVGHANDVTPFGGEIICEYYKTQEEAKGWLHIPDDATLLVAHNAPFEMDWMLFQCRPEIMKFLARGGRIFCTAYAEYLLSNQQDTYPSLEETAPKYGGTHKVDGIKILWEQGVLTADIDKDLLLEYLGGPSGDIENTRKVFYGQAAALVARGMWDMALVRMEGMLANCFCMDSGLHVDRDTAFKQLEEQNKRILELVEGFKEYRTSIPEYVQFKDTSDYHVSAWLFGGPIKYKIKDTWFNDDGTPKYEKADCYKFGDQFIRVDVDTFTAEQFAECVAQYGPVDRAKAGQRKGQPRIHRVEVSTPKQRWYDRTLDVKGVVPLELLPQDIYKEFKKEFAGKRTLADGSPVYSSGKDCIEMLSKRQEFPEDVRAVLTSLLEYAKLDKDTGTYYLREKCDEEGNVIKQSGMLQFLTIENIVYHVLNCTSTVTTRLSSNRPNFQNLPRADKDNAGEAKSKVKQMFTSRFNSAEWLDYACKLGLISAEFYAECLANIAAGIDNGYIIEADYSALEVVTLAAFSKDKNLVQALLDKIDMHCMRLSQQLGEPYADVLRKCKDDKEPEHNAYKAMRIAVKPKAFA